MSQLDYSLPLSTLLQKGTLETHDRISKSQAASWLTHGELDKEEYVRYLMMIWHIYDTLERALERHASHPTLQPSYNPTLFSRAPSIATDISFFLKMPQSTWQTHPVHRSLLYLMPAPLKDYISRVQYLSDSADPSLLLAHSYVRYLGDVSGGQVIRHHVVKAYGLDKEDGLGQQLYDFKALDGSKSETASDFNKIKDWFRKGMNEGVGDNKELKAAIVAEAAKTYEFNEALLSLLKPPSSKNRDAQQETVSQDEPTKQHKGETAFPFSSVVSVLMAICLAHFLLVVGGFTGTQGYSKLLGVEEWFYTLWDSSRSE